MSVTPYNPNDPTQQAFLANLMKGEDASGAPFLGYGGVDLTGVGGDQYGFPQWGGAATGNGQTTHAAGLFQFQPGTWDQIASQFGLNFQNPSDQAAGAWYLAQQSYANATGNDLTTALANGDTSNVNSVLASVWPSLGNGQAAAGTTSTGSSSQSGGLWANIEDFFVRFGLIIVGGAIVLIALWALLSNAGVVPKPSEVAKGVAEGAGAALVAA